jgi:hypothetical protein
VAASASHIGWPGFSARFCSAAARIRAAPVGQFARLTQARVLTVEADPRLERVIRHNVSSNDMSRLIEPTFD